MRNVVAKRIIVCLLAIALGAGLAGCGGSKVKEVKDTGGIKDKANQIAIEKEKIKEEVVAQSKPDLEEVNQHRESFGEYVDYVPNMEVADWDVNVLIDGEGLEGLNELGESVKAEAFILDNRTFVPFRILAESIGAEVGWITESQTVSYYKDGVSIKMTLGYNKYTVNEEFADMDVPPFVIDGKTYVPLRFVIESLKGIDINWEQESKTVNINTTSTAT